MGVAGEVCAAIVWVSACAIHPLCYSPPVLFTPCRAPLAGSLARGEWQAPTPSKMSSFSSTLSPFLLSAKPVGLWGSALVILPAVWWLVVVVIQDGEKDNPCKLRTAPAPTAGPILSPVTSCPELCTALPAVFAFFSTPPEETDEAALMIVGGAAAVEDFFLRTYGQAVI